MLILHDKKGHVTGLQKFPKISSQLHVEVDDDLFNTLEPIWKNLILVKGDSGFELPSLKDTQIAPYSDILEEYRHKTLQRIKLEVKKELETVSFDGDIFQTDDRSILRIMASVNLAYEDSHYTTKWITADNKERNLSGAEVIALFKAVTQKQEKVVIAGRRAKDAILLAKSEDEIEAVDWVQ